MARSADDIGAAWIKQRAVAIAAEQIHILPGVLLGVRLGGAVIQLAPNTIFPRQPFHDAIADRGIVDNVARPAPEIITADDIAAVASTCLVPPQLFTLRQLRIVCGAFRHRIAEAPEKRFSLEAINGRRPDIDHIGPIRLERRRDQVLQRRIGTVRRFSEFDECRKILRPRLIPNVVKETIEPALFPKMCGDLPPVFDSLSGSRQQ